MLEELTLREIADATQAILKELKEIRRLLEKTN